MVFLVEERRPDGWIKVDLPVRPNGSTGWIRTETVSLAQTGYRIVVEIGAHRLTLYDRDRITVQAPVGVGVSETPTPGGVYYVKELLRPPDPRGPYGPYAYGLSGFSNVLTSFGGGDGVIGIHGTDQPSSIGRDVSHGCIRVANDVITRLWRGSACRSAHPSRSAPEGAPGATPRARSGAPGGGRGVLGRGELAGE